MNDDTLARARAVVARMVAEREAGYLAAPGAWDEALAPVIELDAVPVLIRLAEAVGRLRERSDLCEIVGPADEVMVCVACNAEKLWNCTGETDDELSHDPDCPAVAIGAALAELAALDGTP